MSETPADRLMKKAKNEQTVIELNSCLRSAEKALAAARREIEELREWKKSAIAGIAEWEEVYKALGEPGNLGDSKAAVAKTAIKRLMAVRIGRCESCGEWIAAGEADGGVHCITESEMDRNGELYPVPAPCGPVHFFTIDDLVCQIEELERGETNLLTKVERMKEECGRDQRNAARSQKEAVRLLDEVERQKKEIERLQKLAISTSDENTTFYYKDAWESNEKEIALLTNEVESLKKEQQKLLAEWAELVRAAEEVNRAWQEVAISTDVPGVNRVGFAVDNLNSAINRAKEDK